MSEKFDEYNERAAVVADCCAEKSNRSERRNSDFGNGVCVNTDQIYDSCKDRDCIRDQRVYFTNSGQEIIERAINAKIKDAEVIWVYTTVEPVPFNRGYYTVDMKFFIRVTVEAFRGVSCPTEVEGLVTYDKKVILYGSEGNVKIFESTLYEGCENVADIWQKNNLPKAVVEVVDPIALSAKLVTKDDCCECDCGCNNHFLAIPENICSCFDDELYTADDGKLVLVSLGLFSIVRLERPVQLLVDATDFCIPCKECPTSTENNPCELFNTIRFPFDEFFPPRKAHEDCDCGCGCSCGCD